MNEKMKQFWILHWSWKSCLFNVFMLREFCWKTVFTLFEWLLQSQIGHLITQSTACDCGVFCSWFGCLTFRNRCSHSTLIWIGCDILAIELPDGIFVVTLVDGLLKATIQRIFHYSLEFIEIAIFHRWKNRVIEISSTFFDIVVSKGLNEVEKRERNRTF